MKTEINSATSSKINAAATLQSMVNVGAYVLYNQGYIPVEALADTLVVANTVSAGIIWVFRTWFTKP
jgi:hypothetical protein